MTADLTPCNIHSAVLTGSFYGMYFIFVFVSVQSVIITFFRDLQSLKALASIVVTLAGIIMLFKESRCFFKVLCISDRCSLRL